MTPSNLQLLVEAASKEQCRILELDPDEQVDAAKLTGQPEGTAPQMVPRWQLHQAGVVNYIRHQFSLQLAVNRHSHILNEQPQC